jgi:hypothetical protein
MCSSSQVACLAGALACAAQGCGRLGFDATLERVHTFDAGVQAADGGVALDAGETLDASAPDGFDAAVHEAGQPQPEEAAVARGDAGQARDAGGGERDAQVPPVDAGVERDAGLPPEGFDCSAFAAALACADFSELPPEFTRNEHYGNLTVSNGTLKVSTTRPGGEASLITTFAPVYSGNLYARFLLRVPEGAPIQAINLLALSESATPDAPTVDEIDMNLLGEDGIDLFVLGTNARFISDSHAFPRGRFACIELTLQVGDANGRMSVRVDGRSLLTAGPTDTALDRGIARVALGIDFSGDTQEDTVLELDEFVLSRERVAACP